MKLNKSEKLIKKLINLILRTQKKHSIGKWADKERKLSRESSSEAGDWDTKRTAYMLELYEITTNKEVRTIVVMAASQLAKTEYLLNVIGRYIELEPCPMIVMQPDGTMAKNFSKERVAPMFRDCPVFKGLITDPEKKNSDNTISFKKFPGGFLAFVGSRSASALASRPAKIVLCDEVDRYAKSAGDEGAPLALIKKRVTTFPDHKIIITGTPTIKDLSEVEDEYRLSSQGKFYLPCPECNEYEVLLLEKMTWETIDNKAKKVKMRCSHCGSLASEKKWKRKEQIIGKWIHDFPDRDEVRGFWINGFYGVFRSWESIITEWIEVQNDLQKKQVFINTVLAETYEEEIKEKIDYLRLLETRVEYDAEVPDDVKILTAGIDTQDEWFAIEVLGHGSNGKLYGIEYKVIYGNLEEERAWKELDEFLQRKFYYKDGTGLNIYSACMDTGGHHTEKVYDFVMEKYEGRRIFGIKGQGGMNTPIINGFRRTPNNKIDLLSLGVNALKDITCSKLKIIEEGPGYCYFPVDIFKNYDLEYFKSLTAEVKEIKGNKVEWKQIRKRNEALDCRNYAIAALEVFDLKMEELEKLTRKELIELSEKGKLIKRTIKRRRSKGIEV